MTEAGTGMALPNPDGRLALQGVVFYPASGALGAEIPGHRGVLAAKLGRHHSVFRFSGGCAPDRLYHEYDRVAERQAAASGAGARPLPVRRGRDQAAIPGLEFGLPGLENATQTVGYGQGPARDLEIPQFR